MHMLPYSKYTHVCNPPPHPTPALSLYPRFSFFYYLYDYDVRY